jgi:hypothetical protein
MHHQSICRNGNLIEQDNCDFDIESTWVPLPKAEEGDFVTEEAIVPSGQFKKLQATPPQKLI